MAVIILAEFPLGDAVHRHVLDRTNAINDSKKKKVWDVQCGREESQVPPLLDPPNVEKGAFDVRYLFRFMSSSP